MEGTPSPIGPAGFVRSVVSSLATLTAEGLTEAERIEVVSALESLKGGASAAQARITASAVGDREALGEESRSVRADLALARRCSPTLADQHVGVARALVDELPETMAALTRGEISERRATIVVRETACLSREHRGEVDRRLAPTLASLGDKSLAAAARRAGAALDSESLAERHRRAVASRRVSVRPAADGMAWLSILGPMKDVIGAHLALVREEGRRHVIDPDLPDDEWEMAAAAARADTRGKGAWLADRALELLSGRAPGQAQPVEVNLVMTDRTLLPAAFGGTAPVDDCASIPGWGPIPGSEARAAVSAVLDSDADDSSAFAWLRRLFTDPTGRDLVALDSTRRRFHGGLRRFLELRDPTCRIPWCDAPAIEVDHARRAADGGPTSGANGDGLCQRHNQVKEEAGWHVDVESSGLDGAGSPRTGPHGIRITTPTGHTYDSTAPPILGEGWAPVPEDGLDDIHLLDRPLPVDPWGGWVPDPPDEWFPQEGEMRAA